MAATVERIREVAPRANCLPLCHKTFVTRLRACTAYGKRHQLTLSLERLLLLCRGAGRPRGGLRRYEDGERRRGGGERLRGGGERARRGGDRSRRGGGLRRRRGADERGGGPGGPAARPLPPGAAPMAPTSDTETFCESISPPSMCSMAASANSRDEYSTYAYPLGRRTLRSMASSTFSTAP